MRRSLSKNYVFSQSSVGAIIDRPPKIFDFRIFQREIMDIFALWRTDFASLNLRATNGRPYNNLY